MSATHYLAVDLGAESGRVMLGTLDGDRLSLEEVQSLSESSRDVGRPFALGFRPFGPGQFRGTGKAAARKIPIAGISADSWGVDYVLLDAQGRLLGDPYCYRDARTADSPARLFKKMPFAEIYQETGIQFMALNTLYHFEAQQEEDPAVSQVPIIF